MWRQEGPWPAAMCNTGSPDPPHPSGVPASAPPSPRESSPRTTRGHFTAALQLNEIQTPDARPRSHPVRSISSPRGSPLHLALLWVSALLREHVFSISFPQPQSAKGACDYCRECLGFTSLSRPGPSLSLSRKLQGWIGRGMCWKGGLGKGLWPGGRTSAVMGKTLITKEACGLR